MIFNNNKENYPPQDKKVTQQLLALVDTLYQMEPVKDSVDDCWEFFAHKPGCKTRWYLNSFTRYQDTLYWIVHHDLSIEFNLKTKKYTFSEGSHSSFRSVGTDIAPLAAAAVEALVSAKKDWVKHHQLLLRDLPRQYRFGLLQRRLVWDLMHDVWRPDLGLTTKEYEQVLSITDEQEHKYSNDFSVSSVTLNTYLEYCRVAYLANEKNNKTPAHKMTGRELYKARADNRDEGLLDIAPDSAKAFDKWYHSGRGGGHPWEVYRGGNTTHISLGVTQEKDIMGKADKWFIFLNGSSTSRMLETCKIALKFKELKMPFLWHGAKDAKLRLIGRDNIGIIPEYDSLHRANQMFEEKDLVFDCVYFDDFEKNKARANKMIAWLALDPLYPKGQRTKRKPRKAKP